jgi:hypothetical protein
VTSMELICLHSCSALCDQQIHMLEIPVRQDACESVHVHVDQPRVHSSGDTGVRSRVSWAAVGAESRVVGGAAGFAGRVAALE